VKFRPGIARQLTHTSRRALILLGLHGRRRTGQGRRHGGHYTIFADRGNGESCAPRKARKRAHRAVRVFGTDRGGAAGGGAGRDLESQRKRRLQYCSNWTPNTVPTSTAFFGVSNQNNVSFSANTTVGGWTFNAGASNYTFTNAHTLNFTGAGIVINGGSATITNNNSLEFVNTSTAGNATITNNNFLLIASTSTAGNSSITNNNFLGFGDTSTAGNATITNTNTGSVAFFTDSTGGNAQFINNAGGTVDFSATSGPAGDGKISAGSIAGAGAYYLGANQLTVGSNNLSTEVSGVISDCGPTGTECNAAPASGGSLVKVGSGTLLVDGSIASSSLSRVNSGGTLGGIGTVGNTQVNSGGTLAPGSGVAGTTMTVSANSPSRRLRSVSARACSSAPVLRGIISDIVVSLWRKVRAAGL
jgi:hypothetical protein